MKFKYIDYIFPSFGSPLISSYGVNLIIKGQTNLGIYNINTVGIQARLIGSFFLFFSLLLFYHLLIQIPKSIEKGKVWECINIFLLSPFFFTWICCIVLKIFGECFQFGTIYFILMIAICFYFQFRFNKKLLGIYNK